jgi:hypothetical protein
MDWLVNAIAKGVVVGLAFGLLAAVVTLIKKIFSK